MDRVKIGDRAVGMGEPCFVVAEAGSNHDGKLAQAKNLVEVAAAAGCDAVKFQTFKADRIVAKVGDRPKYLDAITSPDESMHDIFSKLELPYEWHEDLRDHARAHGILFFSTPFDETSADLLDSIGVPCFKIASFELNHLPLVEHVARKMKPMIISTGMADLSDIEDALAVIHPHHRQVVLLHCTSSYPAPIEHANLRAIQTMREAFDVPVGYSDHTPGWTAAVAAVALGACVVEKHFTIDKKLPGPDHLFALDPAELKQMVLGIRDTEAALGTGRKHRMPEEEELHRLARRRIFAIMDIPRGTAVRPEMLAILRGTDGIEPKFFRQVEGRQARRDIRAHTALTWDDV
ncbi:MAG TPA: pseudaminic acid synthase [Thermoplasmata archaeon]|nr:pseudaminic acid synthase [Thermoplasmata archaeon]